MRKIVALILCLSGSSLTLGGCISAPAPYEDYVLARAAVRAAQDADSARFSAGLWSRAEDNFRKGERAFTTTDFEQAKGFFQKARQYAERAENVTRLKKFQSGDNFP